MTEETTPQEELEEDPGLEMPPAEPEETPDEAAKSEAEQDIEESQDAIQQLAMRIGWNPKHVSENDREYVSAEDFILRSREIQDTQKRQNRRLESTVEQYGQRINELEETIDSGFDMLREHQAKVLAAEKSRYEAQISELTKSRRAAIKDGNAELAESIDGEIDDLRNNAPDFTPPPKPVARPKREAANPYFEEWHKENQWYRTDPDMTAFADAQIPRFKNVSQSELLDLVEQEVRIRYPDKFKEASTPPPISDPEPEPKVPAAPVQPARRRTASKKTYTADDLSDSQRSIMNEMVRMGAITEKEYIEDLVKIGDVS